MEHIITNDILAVCSSEYSVRTVFRNREGYYFLGECPYEVLTAGLIVTIILTVIELIKQKRKIDNLPEADKRVIRTVSRSFAYVSQE
ncbi:hypothetical protein [Sporosarcina sp. FA9]|uniref:hypothetical protein n=1 Tax=Sporosarcina sp. FA9 TaxID=3413030 RepID=UPI003F65B071